MSESKSKSSDARIDISLWQNDATVTAAAIGRLTKNVEIQLCKALAEKLPDGYLKDTLMYIAIQFESDTRSDFPCIPNLHRIELDVENEEKLLKELRGLVEEETHRLEILKNEFNQLHLKVTQQTSNAALWANNLGENVLRTRERLAKLAGRDGSDAFNEARERTFQEAGISGGC